MAGGDDEILRCFLLQHAVHGHHVLGCPAPVARDVQPAQQQPLGRAVGNAPGRRDDLLRDEAPGSQRRLVVEQNAAARMQPVGVAVVVDQPEGRRLGHGIRAAWMERRALVRRLTGGVAKAFAGPGVVKPYRLVHQATRLEHVERAQNHALQRLGGQLERQPHRGLTREVVHLVGLCRAQRHEHAAEILGRP